MTATSRARCAATSRLCGCGSSPPSAAHRLADVTRADLQRLVAGWQEAGLSPSSIRNTINAVRAIYRSADLLIDGAIPPSPTIGLRLPAVRGRRERIASPDEATRLLRALQPEDRALWATALYAGLRLGELRALDWEHVDLAAGTIRVERSFDPKAGFVEPKSRAGRRRVPVPSVLREALIEHKLLVGRDTGLVFGRSADSPFSPSTVNVRAAAGLERGGARADRSARVPAHLRELLHRRRDQREDAFDFPRAREHHDDA